ncbi:MAG TPA: hypothetical protein PLG94_08090, partial [Smithellaceae bacterium]|nr:hypothetical protein [Smithellaceae bacterium]
DAAQEEPDDLYAYQHRPPAYLVGLDQPGKEEWTEDQLKNLAYVGITRARERLFILYSQKTSLIEKLSACIVVPEETKP